LSKGSRVKKHLIFDNKGGFKEMRRRKIMKKILLSENKEGVK